jgi:hypothetical protein
MDLWLVTAVGLLDHSVKTPELPSYLEYSQLFSTFEFYVGGPLFFCFPLLSSLLSVFRHWLRIE